MTTAAGKPLRTNEGEEERGIWDLGGSGGDYGGYERKGDYERKGATIFSVSSQSCCI